MSDTPYYPATHRRLINTDEEYLDKLKLYGGYKRRCLNCAHDCPQINNPKVKILHCPKYPNKEFIDLYESSD